VNYNVLSLFDGISCGQLALKRSNIKINNYFASEIEKSSILVTKTNFPNTIHIGDIRKIQTNFFPKIDLLIGGSPCQNFSFSGKKNGMITNEKIEITTLEKYLELKEKGVIFEGQSYLFWEYIRLLRKLKPTYFLLENVNMIEKWKIVLTDGIALNRSCKCCNDFNLIKTKDNFLYKCKKTGKIEDYEPIMINSNLVSAQTRKRYYWTNIPKVEQPKDLKLSYHDILEEPGYIAASRGRRIVKEHRNDYDKTILIKQYIECRKDLKSNCITTCLKDNVVVKEKTKRKLAKDCNFRYLTPLEWERLQTLPDNYTDCVPKSNRYKMIGNCWTVDVITHIFKNLKSSTMKKIED